MAKAKLTLRKTTKEKIKVASAFSDVKLGKYNKVGDDFVGLHVEYRNIQQLVDFVQYLASVTGEEKVDEPVAEETKPTGSAKGK